MMNFSSPVALCLIAIALTQAAPHTQDDAALGASPVPEDTPGQDTVLASVSYANAKKHVTQMLQTGKDENACKELSKATSDEVVANVASQQKVLDGMPKGEGECDDEGQQLVSKAEQDLKDAKDDQQKKTQALANANSKKINFGDFEFSELQEGQCTTFFNQKVWQDAKAAAATAATALNTANGALTASEKALTEAKAEAVKMVQQCRCKAKQLLNKTLKEMNVSAQAANTKAWKEAAHMLCVLDGKPEDSCSVPALPTVKATEVSHMGCILKTVDMGRKGYRSGGKKSGGKKFSLSLMSPGQFSSRKSYMAYCKDAGLLPVGCGTGDNYHDCSIYLAHAYYQKQGRGKCLSMPDNWGCLKSTNSVSYMRYLRSYSSFHQYDGGKTIMALGPAVSIGWNDKVGAQGTTFYKNFIDDKLTGMEVYPVCGQFTE